MAHDEFQFYPTTPAMAERAFNKFKNKHISRMLDPSAGNGDLIKHDKHRISYSGMVRYPTDGIEIDASKHPALKALGINVVGFDFDNFTSLSIYSHILMNPPFLYGCKHLLRAWDGIFHGEIVAILNAETIRNPFSAERKLLASIIEQHGSVEFVQDAFSGADSERKTGVEIALVHLAKVANSAEIVGNIIEELRQDTAIGNHDEESTTNNGLMLPANYVENAVLIFNGAVEATRQEHAAKAKANYYKAWLGKTMAEFIGTKAEDKSSCAKFDIAGEMRDGFATEYMSLKDRAWTHLIHRTEIDDKISLAARNRLYADFEKIKLLEFSVSNIYGFLQGLSESAWEIQKEMICETFDLFTRFYTENSVYFMGWKSNDKHKTCGMRLKTTRFILPGFSNQGFSYIGFSEMKQLEDIDKTFCILDGRSTAISSKDEPVFHGLRHLFSDRLKELESGKRLDCEYFEVRYYPRRGTIHFFPKRKDLVERLNRMVGGWRQWLPPQGNDTAASKEFWQHYEKADKFSDEVEKNFTNMSIGRMNIGIAFSKYDESAKTHDCLHAAISQVIKENGMDLEAITRDNTLVKQNKAPTPLMLLDCETETAELAF